MDCLAYQVAPEREGRCERRDIGDRPALWLRDSAEYEFIRRIAYFMPTAIIVML